MARKDLVFDTDVATFAEAIFAAILLSVFAINEWWRVLTLRAPQQTATWHDYIAVILAGWVLLTEDDKRSRFLCSGLLLVELARIGVTWLRLSDALRRSISLWSTLTLALLFSAVALCFIGWVWQRFQTASSAERGAN